MLQETGFDTLLDKNFDYEHEWIEEKVFYDFCNIDYSKINLKNIDAYNIVINFAVLFTRLHNKFVQVRDQTLIERVNTFYGREIMALVAHIKTSFERISKHSGHNKIEIILAFRRV